MLKYLSDRGEKRDVVLLFSSSREDQVVFQDVLEEAAQKVGLKVTITLTDMENIRAGWTGKSGLIDAAMIREVVPDASRRLFFVSGPPGNGELGQVGATRCRRTPQIDPDGLLPGIPFHRKARPGNGIKTNR